MLFSREPPLSASVGASQGPRGETLVRVPFSIFLLFLEAYTLCITKTMAQSCWTLYFDCWRKKKKTVSLCVWPSVVNPRRTEAVPPWPGPGPAVPSLPSSKSSRELKHKPLCERLFCSSVIHFSLGIPFPNVRCSFSFRTSVSLYPVRLTGRLPSASVLCFHFSSCEKWPFVCHSSITYSPGVGVGWGETWGTIAIFKDALKNHHVHVQHHTSATCRWPSDPFKRRGA